MLLQSLYKTKRRAKGEKEITPASLRQSGRWLASNKREKKEGSGPTPPLRYGRAGKRGVDLLPRPAKRGG